MSLAGIFSSASQRRTFLLTAVLVIIFGFGLTWAIYYFSADTRGWNTLLNILISVEASAVFALASAWFLSYFFVDPSDIAAKSVLLPQDIGQALRDIAGNAPEYKIYVRTGRHFRAEVLPLLIAKAVRDRQPMNIEVILLDFRDVETCEKYAAYRKMASFDRHLWGTAYVQKEVMATILALSVAANEHAALLHIDLYLSSRLSTFRIEGSSQDLVVTREDPKDLAVRYPRSDPNHAAFLTEFMWVREAAEPVKKGTRASLPATLIEMFDTLDVIGKLEGQARHALGAKTPYAR